MPAKSLVIVESPTKAKTIGRFLSNDYLVESSYGHIRDLPKSKFGIDVENNFLPTYEVPAKAKKQVSKLKKDAKNAKEIILATDEDREGEAIAYHLAYLLKAPKAKTKRIVFHEITKEAILEALKNPREIDEDLVDAQQARRVLDRIVGYKLSPFLWNKIRYGLSAGRVQSVAVRLIVERERERENFKQEEFWTVTGLFYAENKEKEIFLARLIKVNEKTLSKLALTDEDAAKKIEADLKNAIYQVLSVGSKDKKRTPPPPFMTSTLQQEAARKLGFSAKKTMLLAQKLYEGEKTKEGQVGLITYMRTDSTNLSKAALKEAKEVISEKYGPDFSLPEPRYYRKKVKNAQEAHEAIRPTSFSRFPENVKIFLETDLYKLYNIIWQRALACQMSEAVFAATQADIFTKAASNNDYTFRANGNVLKFPGYLQVYFEHLGAAKRNELFAENVLPKLIKDEKVVLKELQKEQHFTEPPPRYNEASLIKTLEELGIGRPSTYAPTISTIQARDYIEKEEKKFKPTETGILVNDLLVKHFAKTVDYKFTASLEEDLDAISRAEKKWIPVIAEFYAPFMANLKIKEKEVSKKELTEEKTKEICEKCGKPMIIKMGRFGKFMACSNYPECKNTKPLGKEKELREEFSDVKCSKCGAPMIVKRSRFGAFLGCSKYPDCKNTAKIEKKVGVKCPKCGEGELVEKKSKRGRFFYSCNSYPKCDFALWQKPTGEKCPLCGGLIVMAGKDKIKCSGKDCNYTKA